MTLPNWWGDWRPNLTPHTGDLQPTDLLECTMIVGGLPVNTIITGAQILGAVPTPSVAWGSITGTLSSQTDLNAALSGKASTGAVTGTGITMSTATILGRSTAGTGAIEEITIGSGLTLSAGTLTASGGGLTVGTTAIASGTIGRVLFQGTGNVLQQSANLFWDNTNGRLGIGQSTPTARIHIQGSSALSANSSLVVFNSTPTEIFRIRDNGNVQIGALTDAGYKLDVNGTSRFSGLMLISNRLQFGQTGAESYLNTTGATAININRKNITLSNGADNQLTIDAGNGGSTITKIFVGDASGTQPICINGNGRETVFGLDTATPSTSALIRMESTTKGFLPPRMTTTQKNAIASPASGLIVYDTTLNKLCVRTASAWETITSL